ncbi:Clavaminate synthase-like protein [Meredithblackwellia eburnea MCA 4105]
MDQMLPIIDLDVYRHDPNSYEAKEQAGRCVDALVKYGALILKDSRVSEEANDAFLDIMEDYFSQEEEALKADTRPQFHYQVGATLENTEKPKCHSDAECQNVIASLDPAERPLDLEGGKADPKCRFFHRMGITPPETSFGTLAMDNVIPAAFSENWESSMEGWGLQIKTAVEDTAKMLGDGLGVGDALVKAGSYGPHLLAPTATDLKKYGQIGEIFAGFHTDLNFLTIHGRSRFPGLHIWARNTGKKISVKLPPGHLLVQAGKQLEYLTGGAILAGYHEVVCTEATITSLRTRQTNPATCSRPQIRISSTFFWHLSSDYLMDPSKFMEGVKSEKIPKRATGQQWQPPMLVGEHVQNELKHIALMAQ